MIETDVSEFWDEAMNVVGLTGAAATTAFILTGLAGTGRGRAGGSDCAEVAAMGGAA